MLLSASIIGAVFASQAVAIPHPSSHVLHEKRDLAPKGWVKGERVDSDTIMPVRIGMTQNNLHKGYDLLMEVSDPSSPKYGMHYSAEEVHDIFAPSESAVDTIHQWLVSAGVHPEKISQSTNKQWMQLDLTASEIEALLNAKYHHYQNIETGHRQISTDEYYVPAHIAAHLDYITPGTKLFAPGKQSGQQGIEKRSFKLPPLLKALPLALQTLLAIPESLLCDVAITPVCIKTLYNITAPTLANAGNKMGIFEDIGDVYSQTDLNLFFTTFAQNIPVGTHPTLEAVDGAVAPSSSVLTAGPESDLDFQISYPILYPQNTILFQTDDPVYEANYTYPGFFNTFLDAIDGSYCSTISPLDPPYPDPAPGGYKGALQCGVYKPTNVISISYGGQEADLPAAYQQRQCNEFMKLGLQGVSVVLASGDSGVAGPSGDDNADGCLGDGSVFSPDFPATCPYITTVGATYLPPGANVNTDSEVAVTRFGSGGGFSNIYPIPTYQQAAVSNYFAKHPPPYKSYSGTNNSNIGQNGGVYNNAGRGYPDVSAIGDNVVIFNAGAPTLIGGTSAAAPVFAAILNRINEERLHAGKPTLGFVNPTLYANPAALHDITSGSNPGCNTNGFAAAAGWDPVTGLGTPNYPALLKLFMGQ